MGEFEKVAVLGLGYIGLPTAALIASRGIPVHGVDVSERIVETIASGRIHIAEPDLDGLVQKVVSTGTMRVSVTPEPADIFIIAVPTPIDANKRPDLTHVMAAVDSIMKVIAPGNLVILESTCPVGTTEYVARRIKEERVDLKVTAGKSDADSVCVAYCPERVLPGRILHELLNNDRCIGGVTPQCARRAQRFYKSFVRGTCIATTARVAEMVKLTENAYRDINIAFANELSVICDHLGANVWEVIDIANRHPRVNVLQPGPGVGGHCIAVDPWFIVDSAPSLAKIIRAGREINDHKADYIYDQAVALIEEHPYADVACCGVAFKANVDDLRESPALEIASRLAAKYRHRIKVVEPHITALPAKLADHGAVLTGIDAAIRGCEIAIILVDHDEFKMIPIAERRHLQVIDSRGIWQDMMQRF